MAKRSSYFTRAAASMFGLMLILQLAAMGISAWLVLLPLMRSTANDLAALMVLSTQAWVELPAEARPAYADELQTSHRLVIRPAAGPLPGGPSNLPLVRILQGELSGRIGAPVAIHSWNAHGQHWYGSDLPMAGQTLRLEFPAERIGTRPLGAALATLAAVMLASLLPIWLIARRLARPLGDLGLATEAIARGETPEMNMQDAPAEIMELAERFNHMAHEVQSLLKNRDLMLAGLSHDLRTPLARARMALELGRDDPVMLDRIESYLDDVNRLIQQYIDFARGEQGSNATRFQRAADMLAALCAEYRESGHNVRCVHEGEESEKVMVDRDALVRILRNLIDNALKHGVAPVEVCLRQSGGFARLRVRDHGPGFCGARVEELLAPFARGDRARGRSGSGLGLSIVARLCRERGWNFSLRESPEGGVEAELTLPSARHNIDIPHHDQTCRSPAAPVDSTSIAGD